MIRSRVDGLFNPKIFQIDFIVVLWSRVYTPTEFQRVRPTFLGKNVLVVVIRMYLKIVNLDTVNNLKGVR